MTRRQEEGVQFKLAQAGNVGSGMGGVRV